MAIGRDCKYINHNKKRVSAQCSQHSEGCKWRVYAARSSKDGLFAIRNANLTHTCMAGQIDMQHPKASKKWIASMVKEKVRDNILYKPVDIIRDIKQDYRVDISYQQAWRGKERAKEEIHGKDSLSFNSFSWWCNKVMETNPNSVIDLEVDGDRFKRVFVSFAACIEGFRRMGRDLLFVDGTHLKSRYKQVLLSACSLDGNNGLFIIAYAVVSSENNDDWLWFFTRLQQCVPLYHRYTISSDRSPSIRAAIEATFPDSNHSYCIRHLCQNFRKTVLRHNGWADKATWMNILYGACVETNINEFRIKFNNMLQTFPNHAPQFFREADPRCWANSLFEGNRWGQVTNNLAESFNSWISDLRHLPIYHMVDAIRVKIMVMMHTRRFAGKKMLTQLTTKAEKTIVENIQSARTVTIYASSAHDYECEAGGIRYAVCLDPQKLGCSCGNWYLTRMPCMHACAAISRAGGSAYEFVDPCYTAAKYRELYEPAIAPISNRDQPLPTEEECEIDPPLVKRPAGRPRNKRIESQKKISRQKCGRCGQRGHNIRRCNEPL